MDKVLTIAVPAYKIENYLIKCVESMTKIQDKERLDILVIDDGSPDRTGELSDKLALKYPECVRVIHQENKGHGGAINTAIGEAKGRYFKVVDGDDWVDHSALEELVDCLEKADEDVLFHDYVEIYEKIRKKRRFSLPFQAAKTFKISELKRTDFLAMHSFVYKTALLKAMPVRIDEHCYYVDLEYSLCPLWWAKSFCYEPLPVYQYRLEREGQSVSPEGFRKHVKDHERVLFTLVDFYKTYCENAGEVSGEPTGEASDGPTGEASDKPPTGMGRKYMAYQIADRYLRHILKCCRYLDGKKGSVSSYLKNMDEKMKASSPYLYDYLLQEESRKGSLSNLQLRLLRGTGFKIWPLVRLKWKFTGK